MRELVSVIIPLYNRSRDISVAIKSIAEQTYRPVEVVVVDDGSTDGSAEEARRSLVQHGLSGQVHSIPNSGPDAARDYGITRAKGTVLAFLDSDDLFLPSYLQEMLAAMERCQVAWCFSDFHLANAEANPVMRKSKQFKTFFSVARKVEDDLYLVGEGLFAYLLQEQPIFPSAFVMRRSLYERLGPFTKAITARILSLEWEFMLRGARVAPIGYLYKPLVLIRKHEGNLSGTGMRQEEGEIAVLKTVKETYPLSEAEKKTVLLGISRRAWDIGYWHLINNETAASRDWFLESYRQRPGLKSALYVLVSYLPSPLNSILRRVKRGIACGIFRERATVAYGERERP